MGERPHADRDGGRGAVGAGCGPGRRYHRGGPDPRVGGRDPIPEGGVDGDRRHLRREQGGPRRRGSARRRDPLGARAARSGGVAPADREDDRHRTTGDRGAERGDREAPGPPRGSRRVGGAPPREDPGPTEERGARAASRGRLGTEGFGSAPGPGRGSGASRDDFPVSRGAGSDRKDDGPWRTQPELRSEERRVGKEGRGGGGT